MKTLTIEQYMAYVRSTFCYVEACNDQNTWRYMSARPLRYEVSTSGQPCRPTLAINIHTIQAFAAEAHFKAHLQGGVTRVCEVTGTPVSDRGIARSLIAGEYVPSKYGSPLLVFYSPENRLSYLNLANGMYSYADDADIEVQKNRILDVKLSMKGDLWTA